MIMTETEWILTWQMTVAGKKKAPEHEKFGSVAELNAQVDELMGIVKHFAPKGGFHKCDILSIVKVEKVAEYITVFAQELGMKKLMVPSWWDTERCPNCDEHVYCCGCEAPDYPERDCHHV